MFLPDRSFKTLQPVQLIADFVGSDVIQQIEQTTDGLADRELIGDNDTSVLFVLGSCPNFVRLMPLTLRLR